jgi:serine/threonine-protein kinase
VKVLDFGLAKLTESGNPDPVDGVTTDTGPAEGSFHTEEGRILGTAAYMSPEQAGGKPADTRSDVFSFGVVLYEMITGRRAFSGATKLSTLAAVLASEPEPPGRAVPGLPADLEKLIVRCLRKAPERPADGEEPGRPGWRWSPSGLWRSARGGPLGDNRRAPPSRS